MAVETTNGLIANFNPQWPLPDDPPTEGDNHIQLVKATVQGNFANITGTVSASDEEINYLEGVTGNIQQQIDALAFPVGTRMLFVQPAPPSGWTLDATANDRVIRINSSSGGIAGGSWVITGLTVAAHVHAVDLVTTVSSGPNTTAGSSSSRFYPEDDHTHTVTGDTFASDPVNIVSDGSWRPAYLDVVIGVKG